MDEVQMVGGGKTECVPILSCLSQEADLRTHHKGDGVSHPSTILVCRLRYPRALSGRRSHPRSEVRRLLPDTEYCSLTLLPNRFLRVSAVTDVPRAWIRLQLPGYVHEFTELFRRYAVRCVRPVSLNQNER